MNEHERERCISRICSSCDIVSVEGKDYVLIPPEHIQKNIANRIYDKTLAESLRNGILSEDELVAKMIQLEMWSEEEEERIENLPKLVEESKLQLYLSYINFKRRDTHEKRLLALNTEFIRLFHKKAVLQERSAEAIADRIKQQYLICCNARDLKGNRLWEPEECLDQSFSLITGIVSVYKNGKITEVDARYLTRKDPWRGLWAASKTENGVFGKCSSDLTAEQGMLISWSRIYDSVQENPECPPDEVLKNNDMLDGWFIHQHRKREKDKKNRGSDSGSNVKGDEVYMFADTRKDAQRIYDMNDGAARGIIKTRQKQLERNPQGVEAQNTMDAKMEMRQMSNEQFKQKFKK